MNRYEQLKIAPFTTVFRRVWKIGTVIYYSAHGFDDKTIF